MSTPFPDNSDKSKTPATDYSKTKPKAEPTSQPNVEDERPKVGRIVKEGAAIKRSTPLSTKIKNFIIGDNAHSVMEYVVLDVLIPAAKNAVADAVTQGIEQRLFGEVRSASRRTGQRPGGGMSSNGPRVHYDRMSSNTPATRPAQPTMRRGGRYDIGQIIIPTRGEATDILEMMYNIVNQYHEVTVADLMEMAGMTAQYTDRNYGWTNLRGAQIQRVRDGYLLDLPNPEVLEH